MTSASQKLFQSPWVLFSCFLSLVFSNVLLSYIHLPLPVDILIIFWGMLLPLLVLSQGPRQGETDELTLTLPGWTWMILIFLFIFLRLYRLTTLSTWPIVDEGVFSYFATLLKEKWSWELTHGYAQEPVLYTWGQFLYFKIFGNSLFSTWFFPACCSILALPLAWGTARKTAGSSAAVLVVCLMGLSYWPLYLGRVSVQSALMVPWEWLVFLLIAYALDPTKKSSLPRIIGLSIASALGFYIYLAWPLVAFMVLIAILFHRDVDPVIRWRNLSVFLLFQLGLVLPLALHFTCGHQGYFGHLWSPTSQSDWALRLRLPWAYLQSLFWGLDSYAFTHGPLWGGFLNPLLTACFIWGMSTLLGPFWKPYQPWLLISLFVYFLPAFLTNNLEMMRLVPLLPPLILVCAQGFSNLLSLVSGKNRLTVLLIFLAGSSLLDSHQLFKVYAQYWGQNPGYYGDHKSPEFFRAYQSIKELHNQKGNGWILLNFNPDPYDQTLFTATYDFNASENPGLDPSGSTWAALIVNAHEEPYISKLFPEGRWEWLSKGFDRADGGFMLETLPLTASNQKRLERWRKADLSLKEVTYLMMEKGVDPVQAPLMENLEKVYPLFQGDPLLESRYWRIRALHYLAANQAAESLAAYQRAIQKGLPQAEIYDEMGKLLWKMRRWEEARKCFEAALSCKLNLTDAAQNLQALESQSFPIAKIENSGSESVSNQ